MSLSPPGKMHRLARSATKTMGQSRHCSNLPSYPEKAAILTFSRIAYNRRKTIKKQSKNSYGENSRRKKFSLKKCPAQRSARLSVQPEQTPG
jgi:hypothetical protein